MAALAASRVDRLEYLLERTKGAMLLSRNRKDQHAENGIRDLNLIQDLLLSGGAHPPFIEREADRVRARLEHVEDRRREVRSMSQAGFRTDQLVDCIGTMTPVTRSAGSEDRSSFHRPRLRSPKERCRLRQSAPFVIRAPVSQRPSADKMAELVQQQRG
jgi:hypothetical protein